VRQPDGALQVKVNRVFSPGGAFATTCVPDPSALCMVDAGSVAGTVLADTGTVDLAAPGPWLRLQSFAVVSQPVLMCQPPTPCLQCVPHGFDRT
jgi:hypothetical protein